MNRLIVAALSAVTMLFLGINALQYRVDSLSGQSLNGTDAEAYNLTVDVSTDLTLLAGNAVPQLLMVGIIVSLIGLLVMIR